ncbi:MAG: hypothetical protein KGM17_07980 [Sphingomonadales bacterium]|nr:hypothetical protein [Sphingomonadales bacterium]
MARSTTASKAASNRPDGLATASEDLLALYRTRDKIFGFGLFSHAGWEIFLAISCKQDGIRIEKSVPFLGYSPAVTNRWLKILRDNELIAGKGALLENDYVLTERGALFLRHVFARSQPSPGPATAARPSLGQWLARLVRTWVAG